MADTEYENPADELTALINGDKKLVPLNEEESYDDNEDTDPGENESEDEELDTDTNDDPVEDGEETGDDSEDNDTEAEEENAQVDETSSDEEGEVVEDDKTDDTTDESETKESTETEQKIDGDAEDTSTIDYKKQYEELQSSSAKLQGFYDEVTKDFKADGKMHKGFTDPAMIVKSNQMSANYSNKMAGFKEYRPYMSAIKKAGMIDDPNKFNLAMDIANGDMDALKQHMKNMNIDPLMDIEEVENVNYQSAGHIASDTSLSLDDMISDAKNAGVEEKMHSALNAWDDDSVVELLKDARSKTDLIEHLGSGAFDEVQNRISELKRTDVDGSFSGSNAISQYRTAARQLSTEYQNNATAKQESDNVAAEADRQTKVDAEKAKIAESRKAAEYKQNMEQQEKKAASSRSKATAHSKSKKATKKNKSVDPITASQALEGEDLMAYFDKHVMKR